MTNPILEFLRADAKKHTVSSIAMVALDAQDSIKAFIRDYAKAVEAIENAQKKHMTKLEWDSFHQALATAATHRELLNAVKEGV